jgi:hypothetical protein
VQIKARTGTDYTGDPEYAEPLTYPARISYKPRRVFVNGVERTSTARITVAVPVFDEDLIVLPDGTERGRSRSSAHTGAAGRSTIRPSTSEKRRKQQQW